MSQSFGYAAFGVTRASLAEIDDEMRAIRRKYRVERSTGRVIHKQTGKVIGWVAVGRHAHSMKHEDGRDLCDEFSVTHAVVNLHRDPTEPIPRDG